jgi:hypothetical protein
LDTFFRIGFDLDTENLITMLPVKNSAYQRFVQSATERIECDPIRFRTIGNTTPMSSIPALEVKR